MKPHNRKKHHVAKYELENGKGVFVGNPSQAKEFYTKFHPGEKVFMVYNEDCEHCHEEVKMDG